MADIRSPSGQAVFSKDYLEAIAAEQLPAIHVDRNEQGLQIESEGAWPQVSLWETVVLSEVAQAYGRSQITEENHETLFASGLEKLQVKLEAIKTYNHKNPETPIRFMDFGTRRRFSQEWHEKVLQKIKDTAGDACIGTSNVGLALKYKMKALGTYAHEMPMVYGALADHQSHGNPDAIRQSHGDFMRQWQADYPEHLIALTDTFGDDFFYEDAHNNIQNFSQWQGVRQDSGNPFQCGEEAIQFYQAHDIDPATKTIVFSDGLDVDTMIALQDTFAGRIQTCFGIGTNLTHDLGISSLSIVMKARAVEGVSTVKLSNEPSKHSGDPKKIKLYQQIFQQDACRI